MNRLSYRIYKDQVTAKIMRTLAVLSLFTCLVMGGGLLYKSWPILSAHSLWTLVSSSEWSPMAGAFGFWSFICSSLFVTVIAVSIAVPVALFTSLFLTERQHPWVRQLIFPTLDILAGIPSVVYGLWGMLIIVPWIADTLAPHFVDYSSGYTTLAGGIVLSVMILPILVSLFVEILSTVPQDLKDASASLGATRWQTMRKVVLRKASSGLISAIVLGVSKAFGETMAVLMVCGCIVDVPGSVFDACYPLPALIANNYGEMLSLPMYEAALMFAALALFVVILGFNLIARIVLNNVERKFNL